MQVRIWNMILIACRLSNQLDVLLLVFVTIALDAPDNLSTSLSLSAQLESSSLVLTWVVLVEKISKEQLSLGIVQSCSVLLFLNDEVGVLSVVANQ